MLAKLVRWYTPGEVLKMGEVPPGYNPVQMRVNSSTDFHSEARYTSFRQMKSSVTSRKEVV
jgi:hypothetical protein